MPFTNPATGVTIPPGASSGSRIVLDNDIPSILQTFAPANFVFSAVQLWYYDDTRFFFSGVGMDLVAGTPFLMDGYYNGTHVLVLELKHPTPNNVLYGSGLNLESVNWFWDGVGNAHVGPSIDFKFQVHDPAGDIDTTLGRGVTMGAYWTGGQAALSVAAAENAMANWDGTVSSQDMDVTFTAGHLYRIHVTGGVFSSTVGAASEVCQVRVRSALNNTGAQQLAAFRCIAPGQNALVSSFNFEAYVANKTGSNIDKSSLGLTVQRIGAGNNHGLYGDADFPLILTVSDIGLYTDTALGEIAIAVT